LTQMVEAAGFEILEAPDPKDITNVFLAARYTGKAKAIEADANEAGRAAGLVKKYSKTRMRNIEALADVAETLNGLAPKGIAMWGAGRIFDSLIVHGGFDPKKLRALIDTHLKAHVAERHGFPLSGPDVLANTKPGVVVVMSRGFADEIVAEAKKKAPGADILVFTDLLGKVKKSA